MTKKLLIVANNCKWSSWPQKIKTLHEWFLPYIDLEVEIIHKDYANIPFTKYIAEDPAQNSLNLKGIDKNYYDRVFSPLGAKYDILLVVLPVEVWPYDTQARGWRADDHYQGKKGAVELHIACDENERLAWFGHDDGDMFLNLARHEICHALFLITGAKDTTHYWWNQNPEYLKKCLEEIQNFVTGKISLLTRIIDLYNQIISLMKKEKYLWDNPENVRHSCRVIMDEYGLKWAEKDLLCACIQQESGFNPKAKGKLNKNGTQDFGLCQYNNGKNGQGIPYWIGQGADFKDVDEVLNSPEKNVRIMIREYRKGNLKWWSSYSTGAYLKYMPK